MATFPSFFPFFSLSGMSNIGHEKTFEDGATNVTYKVLAVRHPLERLLSAYMYILNDEMISE